MDFNQLKQNRDALKSKLLNSVDQKTDFTDARYWKYELGKDGTATACIRFLCPPSNEDLPYVKYWDHSFKTPNGWYIEKSRTTLGEADPVTDANNILWETGSKDNQNIVRQRKRKLHYVSNILVLKDPTNPDNVGKVFLFEYGKTIFDMITGMLKPKFSDQASVDVFDFWEGADFNLRVYKDDDGYVKYTRSSFSDPTPLFGGDDVKLKQVYEELHSLRAEVAPDKFKSYDDLKARFERIVGQAAAAQQTPRNPDPTPDKPVTREAPVISASDLDDMDINLDDFEV